jgi:NAD(P)-dependent dehydrogenase (short-subunit alcohol dehydrogenase family)
LPLNLLLSSLFPARDRARGQNAVKKLQNDGLNAEYLPLDVNDVGTIKAVSDYLKTEHGGLDILVNNAGIMVHVRDLKLKSIPK